MIARFWRQRRCFCGHQWHYFIDGDICRICRRCKRLQYDLNTDDRRRWHGQWNWES